MEGSGVERPTKTRRRYKKYFEFDSVRDIPRSTSWRAENTVSPTNVASSSRELTSEITTSPNDTDCSDQSDIEPNSNESERNSSGGGTQENKSQSQQQHSFSPVFHEVEGNDSEDGEPGTPQHCYNRQGQHSFSRYKQRSNQAGDPDDSPTGSSTKSSDDSSDQEEEHNYLVDEDESDLRHWSSSSSESEEESPNMGPLLQPVEDFFELRRKLEEEYSEKITDPVVVSRRETLLNLQEFCKRHSIPLVAQEDLHRLINSMFYKEIIPDTTYKLDKLYSSTTKIQKFFYCLECFSNFGELNHKVVKMFRCPNCKKDNVVKDLTKATFFIIVEFINQLQLLLQVPDVASSLQNPKELPDNGNVMKDLYDGDVYKEFVASLDFSDNFYYISLTACTDGTPVFKSSTLSIWPIFVSINELSPNVRMSNVLLAGLWFGRTHPKMDLFLEPFSNYVRTLSVQGFSLNVAGEERLYKAYLIGVCVDSGARGAVQGIHSHNGEFSCNWCLHPGQTEGEGSSARKFLQFAIEPSERSAQEVIRDGTAAMTLPGKNSHVNGVTGISPILRCPKFDVVRGMILDTLHWASFGISRRMGKLWLGETKKKDKGNNAEGGHLPPPEYYVGTDETKAVINRRILNLKPPLEVRRLPRDLSQLHEFNAREWENFALFFSVPLFKNILPERFLKHWTLFVQAFYLLMKSHLKKQEIEVAKVVMKTFVDGVQDLYGIKEMNFNMHISIHAADNALRWGNAWSISTYAFENGNKNLKNKIHTERGIPHQIIRSMDRDSSLSILRAVASTAQSDDYKRRLSRKEVIKSVYVKAVRCFKPQPFSPTGEELWLCEQDGINLNSFVRCSRIVVKNVCYGVDKGGRTNNSFAHCIDDRIVKVRNIIAEEVSGQVFLFVSKVRCKPYPLSGLPRIISAASFSPFLYTVDLIEEGIEIISSESLNTICVNMEVDCRFLKEHFLSVMPNTSNIF